LEDLIALIRSGQVQVSKAVGTTLLRGLDTLKSYVDGIGENANFSLDTTEIVREFHQYSPVAATASVAVTSSSDSGPWLGVVPTVTASLKEASRRSEPANESIRVPLTKLDSIINLIGELVVNQSIMSSHRVHGTTGTGHAIQTLSYMEKLVGEIQDLSMTLRMVPVKPLFQKMARIVRDLSSQQGKEIEFLIEGESIEIDKTILERMTDPITHIVRNAVDHGIESPQTRQSAGKPGQAQIRMVAFQQDDQFVLLIEDDGKGLDAEKIRRKAIEKGLISADAALTEAQVYDLIFLPGFSTNDQITEISGRGVGMDVVRRSVQEIKGTIQITTALGKGTQFRIALPLSLSIIPGLVVDVGTGQYVVPISQLVEVIEPGKQQVQQFAGQNRVLNLRGEVMPSLCLGKLLGERVAQGQRASLVVSTPGGKVSFEVQDIVGQQHVVIKPLGPEVAGTPGILGGAVLSNGEPSLILDLLDLYQAYASKNHLGRNPDVAAS
jgi:two-component system chemotaxis sensor kinase CheA